jgi:hypothetical protein
MSMVKKIVLSQGVLAILATGTTIAGVSGLSVSHSSSVGGLYEIAEDKFGDPIWVLIDDENFSVTGGDELLNYSATAQGGVVNLNGGTFQELSLTSTGSLNPNGGFTHTNQFSAGWSDVGSARGETSILFSVSEEATIEFFLDYLTYNNDFGSVVVELKNLDTDELVFVYSDYSDDELFETTLGAGNYAFSANTSVGALAYSFDVNPVPSPSALGLLGLGGVYAMRRRR